MKILLLDPYGDAYGTGYALALGKKVDLFYITANQLTKKGSISGKVIYCFVSGGKNNLFFKIKKFFALIKGYKQALKLIKRYQIDILHIEWLQFLPVDYFFIKKIKKLNIPIIFTSHNAIPHISGIKKKNCLNKIYKLFSTIIVHGNAIKEELLSYFPDCKNKVAIAKHGTYEGLATDIDIGSIPVKELDVLKSADKVCIFFGAIFYNKGLDRLIEFWNKEAKNKNVVLIILGRIKEKNPILDESISTIKNNKRIIFHNCFIEERVLNAYLSFSDIVLMPYRHASMSGVIFKSAIFKKTVLTTNVGAIPEYLDNTCSFICENNEESLKRELNNVIATKKDKLKNMGNKLSQKIYKECNWNTVADYIISNVYKPLIKRK